MSTMGIKKYSNILVTNLINRLVATLLDAGNLYRLIATIATWKHLARPVLIALPNGKNVISMGQSADEVLDTQESVSETERQRAEKLKIQSAYLISNRCRYGWSCF